MSSSSTSNDTDGTIIGIDLGTSTSAIAFLKENRPELIADESGERIVPSVVQLLPGNELVIGAPAKASAITYHDRTVQEVKRLMGSGEKVKLGKEELKPEEVSALILKHLKKAAEARLGQGQVRDVVLSVPARFENDAREATKRAAEQAGLNVLRLINEPTAAALAYGLDRVDERQKVLVFDFGGGTLDVTVLEMYEGILDVKTSVGDDKLGGKDVDEVLVNLLRDTYKDQHDGAKLPPPSKDRKLAQQLKEEAETYKKKLSNTSTVQVDLPYLTPEGGVSFELTRARLEELLEPHLLRAMTLVNEALGRARLDWSDIDVVLPVGGSSRIPLFKRALEFAWGREIQEYENPDEAVAKGAAIAAGIEKKRFDDSRSVMILDVSPHRLGVATIKTVGPGQYVDDYFSEIIPKDSKLPATQIREYGAMFGDGDTIFVRVYEAASDSNLCREHRMISELTLSKMLDARPDEMVQVEFSYTLDGTLDVAARYVSAPMIKVEGSFKLNQAAKQNGDGSGIQDVPTADSLGRGAAAAASRISPQELATLWRNSPHADHCSPLLEQAEHAEREHPESLPSIRGAAEALKLAMVAGTEADIRQRLDALTDVLFELA
jgi:molecular chaperone DnaK